MSFRKSCRWNQCDIQVCNVVNNTLHSFSIPDGFYSASGLAAEIRKCHKPRLNVNVTYLSNEGKYYVHPTHYRSKWRSTSNLIGNVGDPHGIHDTSTRKRSRSSDEANTPPTTFNLYANNDRYRHTTFSSSPIGS
jgi:hypothetical protein